MSVREAVYLTDQELIATNSTAPLISIITVVYNAQRSLEQSILSVINQTYPAIEYIVVDGGSTDGTLEIIENYRNLIDVVISEPDGGIADAMNKGIVQASGEFVVFIHSDDYLQSKHSLEKAAEYFDVSHAIYLCDILFGNELRRISPRRFNYWMNFKGLPHQGVLCRKRVFDQLGIFDTNFKISMDYDFFLRAYRAGIKATRCPLVLAVMGDTGISSQQVWQRFAEERAVHQKNCPGYAMRFIYAIYWWLYLKYRQSPLFK